MPVNLSGRKGLLPFLLLVILSIASCKKEDSPEVPPEQGQITLRINNQVAGQALQFGQMIYTNAAGNLYQVDLLKYYISNVRLIRADNSYFDFANYDLINAEVDSTCRIYGSGIPNGIYSKLRFYIGIDDVRNHTGAQDGDLDPVHGMIWTWNTGYIFFKHEGVFRDSSGSNEPLLYHLGTDPALALVEIPLSNFQVQGNNQIVHINFDLNQVYTNPQDIDFNGNNVRQSTGTGDRDWVSALRDNFSSAFTFDRVE